MKIVNEKDLYAVALSYTIAEDDNIICMMSTVGADNDNKAINCGMITTIPLDKSVYTETYGIGEKDESRTFFEDPSTICTTCGPLLIYTSHEIIESVPDLNVTTTIFPSNLSEELLNMSILIEEMNDGRYMCRFAWSTYTVNNDMLTREQYPRNEFRNTGWRYNMGIIQNIDDKVTLSFTVKEYELDNGMTVIKPKFFDAFNDDNESFELYTFNCEMEFNRCTASGMSMYDKVIKMRISDDEIVEVEDKEE